MSAGERTSLIHPSALQDLSTGTPGLVAGEIAAREAEESPTASPAKDGASHTQPPEVNLPKNQFRMLIASLFLASFLAALDTTVVTTLLSVIASDLNAVENISWIAVAYLLSCSALQPIFGKLSDIFGRKSLLLICSLLFAFGCCICVTDSLIVLVIGRFITGLGGSGFTTLGTITMSDIIPLRERGLYQGLANICFGLGAASGGLLGGLVSDWLGWKYVFILQIPLAMLVAFAIYSFLNLPPGSPGLGAAGSEFSDKVRRVDFLGAFLLVSALMVILLTASLGGTRIRYSSKLFFALVASALFLLCAFVYTECYVSLEPIIPINVITDRTVFSASLANWFYTMGVFSYLFFIPLFFQAGMGLTATASGERMVANFVAVSFGSVGAGMYMRKTGKYYKLTVVVGFVCMLGMWRMLNLRRDSSLITQFTITLLPGLAYSCVLTVTLLALIAAVPAKYQACTTSIQYTFRSTGSTLGVSIASAIFQAVIRRLVTENVHAVVKDPELAAKIISRALENTNYSKEAPAFVREALKNAYASGCHSTFVFSSAAVLAGYVASLYMREHKLHSSINRDE